MGQKTMNYDVAFCCSHYFTILTCGDLYLFVCIHAEGSIGMHARSVGHNYPEDFVMKYLLSDILYYKSAKFCKILVKFLLHT